MASEARRKFLIVASAALLVAGWQRLMVRPEPLDFRPVAGAPGWHFATAGEISGLSGQDLLTIGLEKGPDPLPAPRLEQVVHRHDGRGAPVAVFSDFFCPYCRELIARLQMMRSRGASMSISWHELPLLGPHSELAARAGEAASLQGRYLAFHNQLLADGFRPLPAWMGEVADRAGLDGGRLLRDMDGASVAARLADSAAAAARLGFFATPGLVVGRKAVLGALDRDRLSGLLQETAA
jgi:predicted DsbA family dithiol-disulfide isomerase